MALVGVIIIGLFVVVGKMMAGKEKKEEGGVGVGEGCALLFLILIGAIGVIGALLIGVLAG